MTKFKLAAAFLAGLFLLAPAALADGGKVKEKAEKDKAAEKAAEKEKVKAAHLPKDRKCRSKEELQKAVKGDEKKSEAIEAKIKVQVEASMKVGASDPKAAEECHKLEAEFQKLAAALDALEACAFEQEALEAALVELIHDANELEETADDLEEIAYVLDSDELYAAVDALDDAVFELDLMIFEIDQALDEMDGTVGDDVHADIFIGFEITIEVK